MGKCYIITVEDGADFNRVMARRVFTNEAQGLAWGRSKRDELQAKRREEGETDEAFIEAIDYHTCEADFGDA